MRQIPVKSALFQLSLFCSTLSSPDSRTTTTIDLSARMTRLDLPLTYLHISITSPYLYHARSHQGKSTSIYIYLPYLLTLQFISVACPQHLPASEHPIDRHSVSDISSLITACDDIGMAPGKHLGETKHLSGRGFLRGKFRRSLDRVFASPLG